MKRINVVASGVLLAISIMVLTACGAQKSGKDTSTPDNVNPEQVITEQPTPVSEPEPSPEPQGSLTPQDSLTPQESSTPQESLIPLETSDELLKTLEMPLDGKKLTLSVLGKKN